MQVVAGCLPGYFVLCGFFPPAGTNRGSAIFQEIPVYRECRNDHNDLLMRFEEVSILIPLQLQHLRRHSVNITIIGVQATAVQIQS